MNRDKEVLLDLIRASRLILEFCETLDYQTFARRLKNSILCSLSNRHNWRSCEPPIASIHPGSSRNSYQRNLRNA
ncbi:MAG: hypothetical protein RIE73_03005 [Coleofasciculus sp. C1-SOL-03]